MRPLGWLYTVPLRLRSLVRSARVERELDEELRYHLERQIEEHVGRGMPPDLARRSALMALGGLEQQKEECREARKVAWMTNIAQDARYGARLLARAPGFAAAAILTIALGTGAATAMFGIVSR
jgi:putative ABC transport system permease protein